MADLSQTYSDFTATEGVGLALTGNHVNASAVAGIRNDKNFNDYTLSVGPTPTIASIMSAKIQDFTHHTLPNGYNLTFNRNVSDVLNNSSSGVTVALNKGSTTCSIYGGYIASNPYVGIKCRQEVIKDRLTLGINLQTVGQNFGVMSGIRF
jgi:hypothetical protein